MNNAEYSSATFFPWDTTRICARPPSHFSIHHLPPSNYLLAWCFVTTAMLMMPSSICPSRQTTQLFKRRSQPASVISTFYLKEIWALWLTETVASVTQWCHFAYITSERSGPIRLSMPTPTHFWQGCQSNLCKHCDLDCTLFVSRFHLSNE